MQKPKIVRINEKGEITIPPSLRDSLGLVKGSYILLKTDSERSEI